MVPFVDTKYIGKPCRTKIFLYCMPNRSAGNCNFSRFFKSLKYLAGITFLYSFILLKISTISFLIRGSPPCKTIKFPRISTICFIVFKTSSVDTSSTCLFKLSPLQQYIHFKLHRLVISNTDISIFLHDTFKKSFFIFQQR